MTTHRGVPITLCAECHREHTQGVRHSLTHMTEARDTLTIEEDR